MSVTTPPALNAIAAARTLKQWHVALIWFGVIVAIIAGFSLFSGRLVFWKSSAPEPHLPNIQAPPTPTAVVRPPESNVVMQQTHGGPVDRHQSERFFDAERAKALASDNAGFTNTQNQSVPAAAKDKDGEAGGSEGDLNPVEASLKRGRFATASAYELPSPLYLIRRGRVLPCIMETRLNSTLPGMITAHIAEPVRGDAGNLTLIPAGSPIVGSLQHALVNGLDRVAILWEDLTTPVLYDARGLSHEFSIPIDSPATGDLGETGLDGDVNHHYLKKIGGILGMSLLQGAIQAGIQSASNNHGGTTLNFNSFQGGSDNAADVLLRSWVAIPDIMERNQGSTCGVGVIRNLDMRKAYRLIQQYRTIR